MWKGDRLISDEAMGTDEDFTLNMNVQSMTETFFSTLGKN